MRRVFQDSEVSVHRQMLITFDHRSSDSPLVERVWRSHSDRAGTFHSIATCTWVIVVTRVAGKAFLTVRGPETMATTADCPADGEWIGVQFRVGSFMPQFPTGTLSNRNDLTLPAASGRSFWLNGRAWEYPTFENAELFVQKLVRNGLLVSDSYVRAVIRGETPRLSQRTTQRRFLHATGMTPATIRQIERARRATLLLREGASIAATAYDVGYFDQAHMTRSLKRFVGQTPAQVVGAKEQLSLLYNTDD